MLGPLPAAYLDKIEELNKSCIVLDSEDYQAALHNLQYLWAIYER